MFGIPEEGFVAIYTRLEFLRKVSLHLPHVLKFNCLFRPEILRKVSLQLVHLFDLKGWFRCNVYTCRIPEEGFVAISTRPDLKKVSLQLMFSLQCLRDWDS